MSKNINRIWHN